MWFFLAVVLLFGALGLLRHWSGIWRGKTPHSVPIVFLNARMAVRPTVLRHAVPDGYRLASLYFGVGLIDRTGTLDHGFPYEILDPIPEPLPVDDSLARLCEQRAQSIVERANRENRDVKLTWSGGIDSTAACVALLKQSDLGRLDARRFPILYSKDSISEYRQFFRVHIRKGKRRKKIKKIADACIGNGILVTGEHGDQLFGSAKALDIPFEDLEAPWEDSFPRVLRYRLASARRVDTMIRYLEPQFRAAPIPLPSLFELLWWMNFSMKWQTVSLRIPSTTSKGTTFQKTADLTEHFFRTETFQRWAMTNPDKRIRMGDWSSYKWPLKDYIRDFTGDDIYWREKEKVPSLQNLTTRDRKGRAFAIDLSGAFLMQRADYSLKADKDEDGAGSGVEFSFEREQTLSEEQPQRTMPEKEEPLWDAIEGEGE